MSKNHCCCSNSESQSSGFVFGVILGAIIGAIIAIIIYKQNKGEVFDILKQKIEDFVSKIKKDLSATGSVVDTTDSVSDASVRIGHCPVPKKPQSRSSDSKIIPKIKVEVDSENDLDILKSENKPTIKKLDAPIIKKHPVTFVRPKK